MSLDLNFDSAGTAPLSVRYDDAGEMQLRARYLDSASDADEGLDNIDTDDLFVSKPYGLCPQTASTLSPSTDCPMPAVPRFRAAFAPVTASVDYPRSGLAGRW